MIIAGLTGGIGHGKTTFANLLAANCRSTAHFESWELVAEVGIALRNENDLHPAPDDINSINDWLHALPDMVSWHVHAELEFEDIRLTPERLQKHPEHYQKLLEYLKLIADKPELANVDITAANKETFRPLLQWLGGYLVARVGPGVWYDEIVRRIALWRNSGTELVTVGGVRYPTDAERLRNAGGMIIEIERPNLPELDQHDITERERNNIDADSIIYNNGTLEDLTICAAKVYEDLKLRQLQKSYTAS